MFREIWKRLEQIQNVTFSKGYPRYQASDEELFSGYEYVANKNMAKAAIQVSASAHDD